jgi:hypothetical protein
LGVRRAKAAFLKSAIDPNRVRRIPHDAGGEAPSDALGGLGPGLTVTQAIEDDVSLLRLNGNSPDQVANVVSTLEANSTAIGADGGYIYSGPAIDLMFNDPFVDPRTPDITVTPNVGVVYTGNPVIEAP